MMFRDLERSQGDKGAGLKILSEMGLEVAHYRVVTVEDFQAFRGPLEACGGRALPEGLSEIVAKNYCDLVEEQGFPLVLLRGSLSVSRPSSGRTFSNMVRTQHEAVGAAKTVYQTFFAMRPPPTRDEAVALILQTPTFQLAELHDNVITGILATCGDCLVIEGCQGADLRRAPKWWNGTSAGIVTWVIDAPRRDEVVKCQISEHRSPQCVDLRRWEADGQAMTSLALREIKDLVKTAWSAREKLGTDICIEWVRTDRLYFHQLRTLTHSFVTYHEKAALGPVEGSERWRSRIAVNLARAAGRLYLPGGWGEGLTGREVREVLPEPYLLVSRTRKGDLPPEFPGAQTSCRGIVDPTIGSRLSHVSVNLSLPYVAVPQLEKVGIQWEQTPIGRVSRDVWEILPSY